MQRQPRTGEPPPRPGCTAGPGSRTHWTWFPAASGELGHARSCGRCVEEEQRTRPSPRCGPGSSKALGVGMAAPGDGVAPWKSQAKAFPISAVAAASPPRPLGLASSRCRPRSRMGPRESPETSLGSEEQTRCSAAGVAHATRARSELVERLLFACFPVLTPPRERPQAGALCSRPLVQNQHADASAGSS